MVVPAATSSVTIRRRPERPRCGTLDFTLGPNRDFNAHLDALGIAHDYIEVPNVGHSVPGIISTLGNGFWSFHRQALGEVDDLLVDGFE